MIVFPLTVRGAYRSRGHRVQSSWIEPAPVLHHPRYPPAMHYEAHQPVIDDLEARILTIRDSL